MSVIPDPALTDWVPLWSLSLPVTYGTALPASPVDGQEHILVDSLTAATYVWRFRYNAGSASVYKWEYVGGAPLYQGANSSVGPTSSQYPTYVDLGGPSITVPRAGDYLCTYGAQGSNTVGGTPGGGAMIVLKPGAGATSDQALSYAHGSAANQQHALNKVFRADAVAAASAIAVWYCAIGGGTAGFDRRFLTVEPIRVS